MKIETFINHGTMIEITGNDTVNLYVDKGQVRMADQPAEAPTVEAPTEENKSVENKPAEPTPDEQLAALMNGFTPQQLASSGIRCQPRVALALMALMQPQCKQKVDWLSFYSVLLNRRWVDDNVRAWCRLVEEQFGVSLDPRTMSTDLVKQGGSDYTLWTEADRRIVRRKQLAADFDNRLTTYFEKGRAEVMREIAG